MRGKIVWYLKIVENALILTKCYATGTPKTFLFLDYWWRRGNLTRNNDVQITHVSLGIIWINHRYRISHGSCTNKAFYIAMQHRHNEWLLTDCTITPISNKFQILHLKLRCKSEVKYSLTYFHRYIYIVCKGWFVSMVASHFFHNVHFL